MTLGSNPNYEVTATGGTFTIAKRAATVTADAKSKTYGTFDPTLTATVTGAVGSDVLHYTLTRSAGEDVGTYAISVNVNDNDNPNYEVTTSGSQFTITRALAMVVADSVTKVYGETDPLLTTSVGGLRFGDEESVISYTVSREAGEDAGDYAITLTGDAVQGNYNVTYLPATFTITRASATVTADDKDKVVGGNDPTLTATVTGLVGSDELIYTLTREAGETVGTYPIAVTGDEEQGNYDVTYVPGTFTITEENEVIVRINGHHNTTVYDGVEHTVSGYDVVSISNPDYSEDDFTFTGTAVASRTDIGTTYMGLESHFSNNKSNYTVTFIVNDGYQTVTPHSFNLAVGAVTWHAIGSPMHDGTGSNGQLTVSNVDHLTNVDYDLFRYNEATSTWENQKTHGFELERGRGYIYRRAAAATLTFIGQPHTGDVEVALTATPGAGDLKGFNLISNPYTKAVVYAESHYTLNTDGSWRAHLGGTIAAGEAFLAYTTTDKNYTFSQPNNKKGTPEYSEYTDHLAITIADTVYKDVVYALFSEGEPLPKVAHLNEEVPSLSIGGYAVARLDDTVTTIPLTLEVRHGEYTIGLMGLMGDVGYCHLIDKVACRDIDLLRDSVYTFQTTGKESDRFVVKLMSNVQGTHSAHFAYLDGDKLVIDGEGTLEAYDVLGRQLFNFEIRNTKFEIQNSQFPGTGVYVLRLGGQTQKIVIR